MWPSEDEPADPNIDKEKESDVGMLLTGINKVHVGIDSVIKVVG